MMKGKKDLTLITQLVLSILIFIGGVTIMIFKSFGLIDMGVLVLSTIILYFFSKSERSISRMEGIIMIMIFVLYYSYVIFL